MLKTNIDPNKAITYTILVFVIIFCIRKFVKSSRDITREKSSCTTKIQHSESVINSYISQSSDAIYLYIPNSVTAQKNDGRQNALYQKLNNGNIRAFIESFKSQFDSVIYAFRDKNEQVIRDNLSERLSHKFIDKINAIANYNVTQTIELEHKCICIRNISNDSENTVIAELETIVDQMSSANNEEDVSYDNPNKIHQTLLYAVKLSHNQNTQTNIIEAITCRDMVDDKIEELSTNIK